MKDKEQTDKLVTKLGKASYSELAVRQKRSTAGWTRRARCTTATACRQFANQDAEVLNRQGVPVSRIEGNQTPEELQLRQQQDLAVKRAAQQKQRDRVLLQTYLSVQEIERLRDSRLDVIDSQILVQQQYMSQLKQKRDRQLKLASVYTPYSKDPEAEELPPELANDLARSDADLRTQQANLDRKRAERASLKTRFDLDIVRFKEVKGMKPGAPPVSQPVAAPPPATGCTASSPLKALVPKSRSTVRTTLRSRIALLKISSFGSR